MMDGGGKQIVCPFKSQEFWKYIGCLLSEVTFGKKGHKIWSEISKSQGFLSSYIGKVDEILVGRVISSYEE